MAAKNRATAGTTGRVVVETNIPPEHRDHAAATLPTSRAHRVEGGTHVCTWTDPTSDAIQARLAPDFLRPG